MLVIAGDILRRTARRLPRKTAIIDGERRIDYRSLDREANRFANALAGRGLGRGDTVGIVAANMAEYAYAFYGASRIGCIPANLSNRATADDIAGIFADAESRVLLVDRDGVARALAARDRLPALEHLVALGPEDGPLPEGVAAYADFVAGSAENEPAIRLRPEDPLALNYTGGTTGKPKAVLVSHLARAMSALTAIVEFDLTERDVAVVSTPLFHTAGLYVWYHPAVMIGATAVFLRQWHPEDFIDAVERHRATAALLVPTQINALLNSPAFAPERLRSLAKINHAGMVMPVPLIERALEAMPWVELTDNYGTTETGPITARRPWHLPEKAHSVGRPAFNVEVEIRDAEGRALPPGEAGEIVTRGDHVLTEYRGDPTGTAELFRSGDGWLWTGDVGYMDEDGFVVLVDRAKEIIIAGGENIYPNEIEGALYQHPAVAECAAFGIPDDHWGELPAAHVVLRPGRRAEAQELTDFCAARIARHKRPRMVKFVDSLPKTPVGKIQRNLIRAEYWKDRDKKI